MPRIYSLILLLLTIIPTLTFAEAFIQKYGEDSHVNWTQGEVCATGYSMVKGEEWSMEKKIEAHRAASLDAMRKILNVLKKIHIDSETTIEKLYENNNVYRKKIDGLIRHFTEKDVRFLKEGICEVDIMVPIQGDGSISDIFLGKAEVPKTTDFEESAEIAPPEESTTDLSPKEILSQKNLVSGLVVDARDCKVLPALNPSIISEDGEELYSFKKANRNFRRINGLVSYVTTLEDARLDKRVTQTPFVIPAKGLIPEKPCVIIIDKKEASDFLSQNGSDRVLEQCKVIIVTSEDTAI